MNTLNYEGQGAAEPLSHLAKRQITKEALTAAAKKGGAIMIRGRELQTKGLLSEGHSSFFLEGMLLKVSDQAVYGKN